MFISDKNNCTKYLYNNSIVSYIYNYYFLNLTEFTINVRIKSSNLTWLVNHE